MEDETYFKVRRISFDLRTFRLRIFVIKSDSTARIMETKDPIIFGQ